MICKKFFVTISAALTLGLAASASMANPFITDPTGGGQSHENHQPGFGINFLISTSGPDAPMTGAGGAGSRYVGEITMFAGNFNPRGWIFPDGQTVSIVANMPLFDAIGTTYGGDGVNDFRLPDLRGRSPMGAGAGMGLTPRALGETSGADEVTLTVDQIPAHTHSVAPASQTHPTGGGQAHSNLKPSLAINYYDPQTDPNYFAGEIGMAAFPFTPFGSAPADGTGGTPDLRGRLAMGAGQGVGLTNRMLGDTVGVEEVTITESTMATHTHSAFLPLGDTGGGQSHENTQPSRAVNYIIATSQALFPVRSGGLEHVTTNSREPFLGEVRPFDGVSPPTGWMFADGSLLSIAQNSALFSILGIVYGGNGQNDFALPDLRGRVPVHVGNGDNELRDWLLGEQHGEESVVLSVAQLPSHTHVIPEPASLVLQALTGLVLLARTRSRCVSAGASM